MDNQDAKMNKKAKEQVVCVLLLVGGAVLCVASIWFPPLIVLGGGLLAGGLSVAANILQDKDRIVINNYTQPGNVMNDSKRSQPLKRAYSFSKEKLGAIFAFGNKRYAQHHNAQEFKNSSNKELDIDSAPKGDHIALPAEMLEDLSKLNELLNKIDIAAIQRMGEKFNELKSSAGQTEVSGPS